MPTTIVYSVDGKVAGTIENGVFIKRARHPSQMLQKPRAWAVDCEAFLKQIKPYTHTMRVEDFTTDTVYEIPTKLFDEKKKLLNRRFGTQYFLPLHYWA